MTILAFGYSIMYVQMVTRCNPKTIFIDFEIEVVVVGGLTHDRFIEYLTQHLTHDNIFIEYLTRHLTHDRFLEYDIFI